jgi:hypothetical protein
MTGLRARIAGCSVVTRAVVLLPVMMTLWWFVLKGPSLWLLAKLSFVPLALVVGPPGQAPIRIDPETKDWTFQVQVNAYGRNSKTNESQYVETLAFSAEADSLAFYASSWFSYLALALAAGGLWGGERRRVLRGLGIETGLNVGSVVAYAYINGYGSVLKTAATSGGQMWMLEYLYHLISLVLPFAGPFVVAVMLHREWQEYLGFAEPVRVASGTGRTGKLAAGRG